MKKNITQKIALSIITVFSLFTVAKAQTAYDDQQYAYTQPNDNGYAQPVPNNQQSFYYYPNSNVYYDINCNRYIYNNGYGWATVNALPANIRLTNEPRYMVYHRGPQVWLDNPIHYRNFYKAAYRQPVAAFNYRSNDYRHEDFGRRDIVRREDFRYDNHHDFGRDRGGHRW
jgi:hypothetical protein